MKPPAAILCLLVTVTTVSARPQAGKDTGTPRAARTPRVREVRFAGDPAFEPDALKKVLQELESRRVILGIWTRRPLYETRAVEADLARLRSFYFSQGYFDARVGVAGVTVDGGDAILTLEVQSGREPLHLIPSLAAIAASVAVDRWCCFPDNRGASFHTRVADAGTRLRPRLQPDASSNKSL